VRAPAQRLCIPSPLYSSSRHRGLLTRGFAARRYRAVDQRWRHRLPRPLQGLSTSRAFRLTSGRAWSIDRPSRMHTSMARAEVPARTLPGIYLVSAERRGARMHCPHCQDENGEGARFRAACGKSFLKGPRVRQATRARSSLLPSPWAPQPARRLLPHPSRWHLDRRRPRHTPACISPRRSRPPAPPRRGNARRARRRSPMSRLRWSCWPTGTCERHGTRWPLSWVVGLKNRRPKQSALSAYRTTWPTVQDLSLLAGPLRDAMIRHAGRICEYGQEPAQLRGCSLVIDHTLLRSWGSYTGMPSMAPARPHGNARSSVHSDREGSESGHRVVLFDRTTREWGTHFQYPLSTG
jgi:hypothetical protein